MSEEAMLGINLLIQVVGRGKWEDTQGRVYEKAAMNLPVYPAI